MNTEQLTSFIQVAENLNFARAAEILNITQSAVSRQIHSLEEELGTKLLYRTTRTVTLTPAGLSFLEDAKSVIARLNVATEKIRRDLSSNIEILSIGCGSDAELDFLGVFLKFFREKHPQIHPFLRVIPHRSILNLFYHGEIELLFGFQENVPMREDILFQELLKLPLCVILPKEHRLAQKEEIREEELYSESMITCNSYAIPARAVEIQSRVAQHLLPESIYVCESMQVLLTMVKAGYGCTILPMVSSSASDLVSVPLKDTPALSYGIFYKNNFSKSLIKDFLSIQ